LNQGIAFDQNARQALENSQLRTALNGLTHVARERRLRVLESTSDWEALRTRARAIKDETLERLDYYLDEFTKHAEAAGAIVHRAATAEEACALVVRIAREHRVQTVVKSKSMLSEEIHLNNALQCAGIDAIETDLGEWILQLAKETPSHIVVPAIHKTRREIAGLFSDRLGTEADASAEALTSAARQALRPSFASATMGVSGVNFGIAATGSILILENEGNARLVTSLPPVHVALMGIEKLIPRLADLDVFLKLLPRAGTGQRLTTYQSLITGVVDTKSEGPKALHIILVDNGRSKLLRDPIARQALACIRCGACLNACPVYQQVGGHAYDSVYPGPIGAVITPRLIGLEHASQLPYASTLCGACREVCPVKIDIPALLIQLRGEVANARAPQTPQKRFERLVFWGWSLCMRSPMLYRIATRSAWMVQTFAAKVFGAKWEHRVGRLAPPLLTWSKGRELPQVSRTSFRELWKRGI
jgi:L-lactate dehydrogenase complex protein LldF